MNVVYHPAVQGDLSRILRHYDSINDHLGDEFFAEFNSLIAAASERPQRFHFNGNRRRANLKHFPYHFLFREIPGGIRITVLRHNKRHPRYGRGRV